MAGQGGESLERKGPSGQVGPRAVRQLPEGWAGRSVEARRQLVAIIKNANVVVNRDEVEDQLLTDEIRKELQKW